MIRTGAFFTAAFLLTINTAVCAEKPVLKSMPPRCDCRVDQVSRARCRPYPAVCVTFDNKACTGQLSYWMPAHLIPGFHPPCD